MNFHRYIILLISLLVFFTPFAYAERALAKAITKPIPVSDLQDYKSNPAAVKELIQNALALSQKKLTYLYGSANPKNKGMDCSGTIYYLLNSLKDTGVPRQANEMYVWAENSGNLHKVTQQDIDSSQFSKLKPGDLLFWSGTYAVHRYPAITHVMIYLGKNQDGDPLMFGASNGRRYHGKKMWGVSVFDFELPQGRSKARFKGYSCIPNLTCA